MRAAVEIIACGEEEVLIRCFERTREIEEIEEFVTSRQERLEAFENGCFQHVQLSDICYVESVDNHLFLYTEGKVYEMKSRLYEFEERFCKKQFFRCSKAVIVNLMKIEGLKPALNGRMTAALENGERIIISRKYVRELRSRLKGGWGSE